MENKTISLFQQAKESEKSSNKISLKKLCKYVDKLNPDYSVVNMKLLFDAVMKLPKEDQILFNMFFVENKTLKSIIEELSLTRYSVRKNLQNSLKNISFDTDVFHY